MNRARTKALAATAMAALVVASPAWGQESPGPNGAYDLRQNGGSVTQPVPPSDPAVIEAIPDQERYAELSQLMSEKEAAFDQAIQAEAAAKAEGSAAYGANDSAGGDAAFVREEAARNQQETLKAESAPLAQDMAALESEGEDALRSGGERAAAEAADDMFEEQGEKGAAADDAPDQTVAGARDGLQREPQQPQQAAPASEPAPARAPEADPDGASDSGGGLNLFTFLVLVAVLAGVVGVVIPLLLKRAKELPGGGKVAAVFERLGRPLQASADDPNKPDPNGPAPRMEPWRPDVPPSPSPEDPGPPEGRIERVKPHAPDPSPTKPGPAPAPAPPTSDLDGDGDLPPDEDDVPPWERSRTPERVGSPKPRPRPDAPLTPEEMEYFGVPGPDAPPAGTPRPRTRRSPLSPPPPRPSKVKAGGEKKPDTPEVKPAPPVAPPTAEEKEILRRLPESLRSRTIGQDHACDALAEAVQGQRVGFGGDRPVSVMFAGTTGVGKTETAKALADALFGGEDKMIRLDMSEYQDKLQASRFVGSPPGYVGHDETPPLVAKMIEDPRRVVLFDEIEKAHPDILTYLLQILDDGRLTSSKGETLDFGQAVVVLTSNLGSEEIRRRYEAGAEGVPEREAKELLREKGMRPELVARIGEIVTFRPLAAEHVREIAKLMLRKTSKKFQEANDATLELTDEAVSWVSEKGYEPENGARPLRGVIARHVEKPLSRAILSDEISAGDAVTLDVAEDGKGLVIRSGERARDGRGAPRVV